MPDLPSLRESRARARVEAHTQGGVLSRRLLDSLGYDAHRVAREVAAGRWARHGLQTVAVHTGPLDAHAQWWRAVWEVGVGVAAVDGVTALQVAGMTGFAEDRIHVSVKHTASVRPPLGVVLHKVIRRVADEVIDGGLPLVRPAIAAVRAAHWATSDRQAALVLSMVVQQRLVRPADLEQTLGLVRGRTRRAFIRRVVADLGDGAQSLGELDFAALCRGRGLPSPDRQVVRCGTRGRTYLDVRWDRAALVVEIDGSGHREGLALMNDNLRQNAVALSSDLVLRIDLLGLRLAPDLFLDQVCAAYYQRVGSDRDSR